MQVASGLDGRQKFYLHVLKREFAKRQRVNPAYSLRSFSRFLGVPASSLALVLKEKRPFPIGLVPQIAAKLNLSPEEGAQFERSVLLKRVNLNALVDLPEPTVGAVLDDENYFRVIAEWEHYAVLHLMDIPGLEVAPATIANRLGISEARATDVWERLLDCGLLARDERGKVRKTYAHVKTTDDVSSQALRRSHTEALEMGIEKLNAVPIDKRDYSSLTLAIDSERIPQFKKLLKEFRQKLTSFSEEGNRREVYQFCFQMYPLTQESP
jgi:uncharacterized protein (TIGR02147 family)